MPRLWIVSLFVVAGLVMWLAVGWPSTEKEAASEDETVAATPAVKSAARLAALGPDAATGPGEPAYDEPPPEPAPAPAAGPTSSGQSDFMPAERGPIQEYQALYDRSTRDSAAHEVEGAIKTAFSKSTQTDLLHSMSCREQVCKVLIRWSPESMRNYVVAMRGLALGMAWPPGQPGFESQIAISTASQKDQNGGRLVELLIKRRSPNAAKPTFAGSEKPH
jgi:hypothetical protein